MIWMTMALLLGGAAMAAPDGADNAGASAAEKAEAGEDNAKDGAEVSEEAKVESAAVLQALELPGTAQKLRELGVPDEEVGAALEQAKDKGVPAGESQEVMEATRGAVEENGPVDNFGAFVQSRLDEGLRGQDLAAAIRAEHQANGKGKGKGLDGKDLPPRGKSGDKGKPDDKGGKPDDVGGKPDDKGGKPDDKGGKPDDVGGKPDGKGGKPDGVGGKPDGKGGKPDGVGGKPDGKGGKPDGKGGNR